MSDNIIDVPGQNAGQPAPVAPQQDPSAQDPAPGAEASLSAEAKSWRLKFKDAQATAAQVVEHAAGIAEKLRATERQLVDQHIGARIVSTEDFWSRTEQADLTGEDGHVDLAKVDAHLADVLAERPHWAAPSPDMPLAAPAASVSDNGLIGYGPRNMLDTDPSAQAEQSWAKVLGEAADRSQ